ncbi:disintegrin and metalloproteinase domain-containing protein 10 homolog [Argiope bruennichi]|uniref:Disintegrin and metalloproteinase like protein n=1 Tax=Argiope bruennichi TaxID=94029 RepID=A0A8T0FWZ0_ARGBR|nr:disintegrin and metalloproteinase domain-containing protein 10 homolog [Argiope bruennichi]KAF8795617.1 Disintegrin and metalloproteinase like protein [Argiope bruennichi]
MHIGSFSLVLYLPAGWLFLFIATASRPAYAKSMYDHKVKNYEIITPSFVASRNTTAELEIQFRAFNRSFCLFLHEDVGFQDVEVVSFENSGSFTSARINSAFFEGATNDTTSDVTIAGYLCNQVFCGTFVEGGDVYFMESAEFFLSNSSYYGSAVIYRSEDVEGFIEEPHKHEFKDSQERPTFKSYLLRNLLFPFTGNYFGRFNYPKGIDRSAQPDADYACRIEMVADHTIYHYFNKDTDALSAFLYLHGKYADSVFRKTDFDGDGLKDNIRIIVKKIFVYKSENDADYPMAYAADLLDFLKRFTRRIQNHCLSVCLCYRRYSSNAIGRAYKPTPGIRGTPGGICQKVLKLKTGRLTYVPRSLNTAAVTIRNSRGQTLPLITTLLAVTHEIGHSFGSDHDPMDNLLCSPGGEKGYYLMHPKTTRVLRENSNVFSPCSRQEIYRILQEQGECLKIYAGTCGNGIREGDEECDCGWEGICKSLDPCCTPVDAKSPEKPCTIRRLTGAHCSPKESPCCSDDCSMNANIDRVCYKSDAACLISYCETNSSTCPEPQQAPEGYPCQGTSKTCHRGACNSSICQDNGLKNCTCKEKHLACFVCCEKGNKCQPAHTIALKNPWTDIFAALARSHCSDSGNFRCDGAGNCINIKGRKIDDKSEQRVLWWTLAILIAVFVILIIIFLYLLKTHLSPSTLQTTTTNLIL